MPPELTKEQLGILKKMRNGQFTKVQRRIIIALDTLGNTVVEHVTTYQIANEANVNMISTMPRLLPVFEELGLVTIFRDSNGRMAGKCIRIEWFEHIDGIPVLLEDD